jgi:hypothetical protein
MRRLACALVFLFLLELAWAQRHPETLWHFAVSGDSRNCGDVVMPAIAQSVIRSHARFYWHLGDFRAIYTPDEDLQQRYACQLDSKEYQQIVWADFVENQLRPFAPIPVRLGIGNHEIIQPKTVSDYLSTFGYWLDTPDLRRQRLTDTPQDPSLRPYYHWKEANVDFIYLDNSSNDGFDDDQLRWFEHVLAKDKTDNELRTIVVAMHRALPNSLACGHSMNGDKDSPSPKGTDSGRRAYSDLVQWQNDTNKAGRKTFVYVLASHSHFFMQDLYDTDYWKNPEHGGVVLPGWIVGTAGAKRYSLPDLSPELRNKTKAETDVWGYLLGTVAANGEITFDFVKLPQSSVPASVRKVYGDEFVDNFCYKGNNDPAPHDPPASCSDK